MRILSVNGNVLTVDEATCVAGDRLVTDNCADGKTPRAGSMLVESVDDQRIAVSVDGYPYVTLHDYLFVSHSAADRARAQAVADALAAPFPGLSVRAVDDAPGEWRMLWRFKP